MVFYVVLILNDTMTVKVFFGGGGYYDSKVEDDEYRSKKKHIRAGLHMG
jgi:hypothetical protein